MFLSLPAAAGVTVSFRGAETGPDPGYPATEAQRVRKELARHLEGLGTRYLRADQDLRIEFLEIDLGGRVHYTGTTDIRVMRAGEWPRMRIRYELASPGEPPRKDEEVVSDQDYLRGPHNDLSALAREKRMLDEWFRARFGPGAKRP
jgi:hypothetical protein